MEINIRELGNTVNVLVVARKDYIVMTIVTNTDIKVEVDLTPEKVIELIESLKAATKHFKER